MALDVENRPPLLMLRAGSILEGHLEFHTCPPPIQYLATQSRNRDLKKKPARRKFKTRRAGRDREDC